MFCTDIDEKTMCRTPSGNKIYWLITQENGAPNFELRYLEIPAGGKSSAGSHAHEHEVFVIRGKGKVVGRDANGLPYEKALVPGLAVFIPGNEKHQWLNTAEETFGFICVVPKGAEAENKPPCHA